MKRFTALDAFCLRLLHSDSVPGTALQEAERLLQRFHDEIQCTHDKIHCIHMLTGMEMFKIPGYIISMYISCFTLQTL